MQLNNDSSVVLPDDVQQAVTSAQNNVTLMEIEVKRLRGIAADQETLVRSLLDKQDNLQQDLANRQKAFDAAIAEMTAKKAMLEEKLGQLTAEHEAKHAAAQELSQKLIDAKAHLSTINDMKAQVADILKSL